MLVITPNINSYFINQLQYLECSDIVRSYLVGALSKYRYTIYDYSNTSLTLTYSEARAKMDFEQFQNIGDWIFTCQVYFPQHLKNASQEYYHSLAQSSYYTCYKLINKQIEVYERLADEFVPLTLKTKAIIQNTDTYDHKCGTSLL